MHAQTSAWTTQGLTDISVSFYNIYPFSALHCIQTQGHISSGYLGPVKKALLVPLCGVVAMETWMICVGVRMEGEYISPDSLNESHVDSGCISKLTDVCIDVEQQWYNQ